MATPKPKTLVQTVDDAVKSMHWLTPMTSARALPWPSQRGNTC